MSKKRTALKYALAASQTGLLGASVYKLYQQIEGEPRTMTARDFKNAAIGASLLGGITWLCAKL